MGDERSVRGQLQVVFVDGTRRSFRVCESADSIVLEWPGEGGIANEHVVRAENASSPSGWMRELWGIFDIAVKTYDYIPARGQ